MVSLTGCICMQTYLKLFLILSVGWYLLYIYLGVIRVYVCVRQHSSLCLWPRSSGALSLSDRLARSEEGQSRQELI